MPFRLSLKHRARACYIASSEYILLWFGCNMKQNGYGNDSDFRIDCFVRQTPPPRHWNSPSASLSPWAFRGVGKSMAKNASIPMDRSDTAFAASILAAAAHKAGGSEHLGAVATCFFFFDRSFFALGIFSDFEKLQVDAGSIRVRWNSFEKRCRGPRGLNLPRSNFCCKGRAQGVTSVYNRWNVWNHTH